MCAGDAACKGTPGYLPLELQKPAAPADFDPRVSVSRLFYLINPPAAPGSAGAEAEKLLFFLWHECVSFSCVIHPPH